jgi:hypothetical protein
MIDFLENLARTKGQAIYHQNQNLEVLSPWMYEDTDLWAFNDAMLGYAQAIGITLVRKRPRWASKNAVGSYHSIYRAIWLNYPLIRTFPALIKTQTIVHELAHDYVFSLMDFDAQHDRYLYLNGIEITNDDHEQIAETLSFYAIKHFTGKELTDPLASILWMFRSCNDPVIRPEIMDLLEYSLIEGYIKQLEDFFCDRPKIAA